MNNKTPVIKAVLLFPFKLLKSIFLSYRDAFNEKAASEDRRFKEMEAERMERKKARLERKQARS